MDTAAQLATRFREVIFDGTRIANTNYKAQMDGLHWQQAVTAPEGFNSAAVLLQHIHYYIAGVARVFEGGPLTISDRYSFDFPAVTDAAQWAGIVSRFFEDAERLARLVEGCSAEQLHQPFVKEAYGSYQQNIEAMIEHCYYHLGQIVLIKKLGAPPNEKQNS